MYVIVTRDYIVVKLIIIILKGPLVSEVYQQIGTWAGQVIRLYHDSEYFEIEWTVGPIDVRWLRFIRIITLISTVYLVQFS